MKIGSVCSLMYFFIVLSTHYLNSFKNTKTTSVFRRDDTNPFPLRNYRIVDLKSLRSQIPIGSLMTIYYPTENIIKKKKINQLPNKIKLKNINNRTHNSKP